MSKELEGYIKQHEATIKRLSKNDDEFSKNTVLKSQKRIEELKEMIDSGNTMERESNHAPKRKREKVIPMNIRKNTFENEKNDKFVNYDKEFKYYCYNLNKIKSYLFEKLANMPNNKGYIYNGIHLYGDLPREKFANCDVMFENKKDGQYIYEIYPNEKLTFVKYDKFSKKVLVKKQKRKKINECRYF